MLLYTRFRLRLHASKNGLHGTYTYVHYTIVIIIICLRIYYERGFFFSFRFSITTSVNVDSIKCLLAIRGCIVTLLEIFCEDNFVISSGYRTIMNHLTNFLNENSFSMHRNEMWYATVSLMVDYILRCCNENTVYEMGRNQGIDSSHIRRKRMQQMCFVVIVILNIH